MLPITQRTLAPGVTLRVVQTKKFKTSMLSATFLAPLMEETASLNALLPQGLRRGTQDPPDMEALSAALADRYGCRSPAGRADPSPCRGRGGLCPRLCGQREGQPDRPDPGRSQR